MNASNWMRLFMDDITIRIGKWAWVNRYYEIQLLTRIDDPQLYVELEQWCIEYAYWNTDLVIGGKRYGWPEEGEDKVLKPKYVVKHIMYCIDLHRSFYELS